jgi:hypothetical protein
MPFIIPSVKCIHFVNTTCFHSLVYFVKKAAKIFPVELHDYRLTVCTTKQEDLHSAADVNYNFNGRSRIQIKLTHTSV